MALQTLGTGSGDVAVWKHVDLLLDGRRQSGHRRGRTASRVEWPICGSVPPRRTTRVCDGPGGPRVPSLWRTGVLGPPPLRELGS